jgi:hypothetical protein
MRLFITILSGISVSFDAICINLASTTPSSMGEIEYCMLGIQIFVLIYNIMLMLFILFKNFNNISKPLFSDIIIKNVC